MFRLFKHLKKYSKLILTIVILILIQAMMELLLPTIMSKVIDDGIIQKNMQNIFIQTLKMGVVIIIAVICSITSVFLACRVSVKFGQDIRKKVFVKVQSFSSKEFNNFGVASLITRTTNDITQVQTFTILMLRMMIFGPLMIVGGLIVAINKDFKLSGILLITIPFLIFTIILIGAKTIKTFSSIQKKLDKVNLISRENLIGIRVIRAFNKQKHEEKRFDDANKDLTNNTIKAYKIFARLMPLMMIIFYFNSIAVVWFGGKRISTGTLMIGDLIAFVQYSNQIMISLMIFFMLFAMIPKAISSAKRINEILEIEISLNDPENSKNLSNDENISLKFSNVSFSYNGTEECEIQNIDFKCNGGETIAIIGRTGSGKSTILNLIPRFYDVTKGNIFINGIDIRDLTQKQLREVIGYVPQKAVLFSGTVRSNLCYGKENLTEEEMFKSLKIAQAYDFVMNLDKGLDSEISQGGSNLSGGQKQRLSIARALTRDPKIYLFDDSFSALDFKTDAKLRAELRENVKNSIVIIVAQRVSSVMNADKIIVLDNGKVLGIGTHKDLMENCEVYQEIAKSQLSEEELS